MRLRGAITKWLMVRPIYYIITALTANGEIPVGPEISIEPTLYSSATIDEFIAFGICAAVIVVIYILIEIRKAKKRTFTIVTNSQPSSMSSGPNYEEIARQRQQRFLDRNGRKIAELTPIEAVPSHVVDNQLRNKKIFLDDYCRHYGVQHLFSDLRIWLGYCNNCHLGDGFT